MGLVVHFRGGPLAGKSVQFDDNQERIVLGRDPDRCQVVFPADDTRVGREHFALIRELGRYRLQLNHDDPVFIDGKPAIDGQELRAKEENVQIGKNGPTLVIETVHSNKLVSTDQQGRQHGQITMLEDAERKASASRRAATIATLLVLLAAGAGYWGYRLLNEDVGKTVRSLDDLAKVTTEQKESLKGITTEVTDFKDKIKEVDKINALERVVRNASPSVYLVMSKEPNGNEETQATAWVVDKQRGILATNAHVGEIPDDYDSGTKLIVRSNTPPFKTFTVKDIKIHPGYRQFARLWNNYDPAEPVGTSGARSVRSAGWGCDVALLTVEDPEGLADALPLAPREVLEKLEPGYPVALIGYPMEGLVLGGVNAKAPTPTRHMAYLTAVTSYFGDSNVPYDQKLLVQHALPTVGGASGSPILNGDGQVVAIHNAGNVIGSVDSSGVRITSGARISYGQRADLIREMLDGTVDGTQTGRRDAWEDDINRYYKRREQIESDVKLKRDDAVKADISDWAQQLVGQDNYEVTTRDLTEKVKPSGSAPTVQVTVPEAGMLRVLAYGAAGDGDTDLWLVRSTGSTDEKLESNKYMFTWLHKVQLDANQADKLDIHLKPQDDESPMVLRAYLVTRKRIPPDKRTEALLNEWKAQLAKDSRGDITIKKLFEGSGTMPAPSEGDEMSAIQGGTLKLPAGGDYFIVASTPRDDSLGLYVVDNSDADNPKVLGSNVHEAPLAHVPIKTTAPTQMATVVIGNKKGTPVDVKVYQAATGK